MPAYRAALAAAGETDTRITRVFSGRPARGIVNATMERLGLRGRRAGLPGAERADGAGAQGRRRPGPGDALALWAGQGVAAARPMPAGELVAVLEREWRVAVAGMAPAAIDARSALDPGQIRRNQLFFQ